MNFYLSLKSNAFKAFHKLATMIQNEKNLKINALRSNHGGEFWNEVFETFCEENEINHNFFIPRIPQHNGVVERKNISLEELERTMLNENDPHHPP